MNSTADDALVQKLAFQFSKIIRELSTPDQQALLIRRLRGLDSSVCALRTQMQTAFEIISHQRFDPDADNLVLEQMIAAWTLAARQGFSFTEPDSPEPLTPKSAALIPGTFADIRTLYPHLQEHELHSGYALRYDCAGGSYVLLTERDILRTPSDDATEIDMGLYSANGDILDETRAGVGSVPSWIQSALSRSINPQNLADYFAFRLGERAAIGGLRDLPLDSQCGRDCAAVVDNAAALIQNVRSAFGSDVPTLHVIDVTATTVATARQVIAVYWSG